MPLTPKPAYPVSIWKEPPPLSEAFSLAQMYWHYDATAGEWTLTADKTAESGELSDASGTGNFNLVAGVGTGTRTLRATRRADGVIFIH